VNNTLICTFVKKREIEDTLDILEDMYTIRNNKIFLLATKQNFQYILSYNIDHEDRVDFLPNSILVHRKKETNTLYTINALNELIVTVNNGVLDHSFQINWELYRNMLLVSNEMGLKKIQTELRKIYHL
jgi:pentatricopeptide repeat protein